MGKRYYGKTVQSSVNYEFSVLPFPSWRARTVSSGRRAGMTQDVEETRLNLLRRLKEQTGLSLDFWDELCQDLDNQALESMADRAVVSPSTMKSRDS